MLAPVAAFRELTCSAKCVRLAFYSKRKGGEKRKSRMKGKGGKKRIRGLGATGMCSVKHHQCQLWAAGPGLAPIHKSRCLGRLAEPVWIGRGVVAGPPDAGWGLASLSSLPQSQKSALVLCRAESIAREAWMGAPWYNAEGREGSGQAVSEFPVCLAPEI